MNDTIRFAGVPNVRLNKVDGGWQIQRRNHHDTPWYDIDQGFFFTREEAIDGAQEFTTT